MNGERERKKNDEHEFQMCPLDTVQAILLESRAWNRSSSEWMNEVKNQHTYEIKPPVCLSVIECFQINRFVWLPKTD